MSNQIMRPDVIVRYWDMYGDELLLDLALTAAEDEELGRGETTDLLAVPFSAPEPVGHQFGPGFVKVQETFTLSSPC